MYHAFAAAIAGVILLSACAASAPPPANPAVELEGTQWNLRGFDGHPAPVRSVGLRFEAGRISGRAPCNTITASYTRDGDALRLGPIAASKMYCEDGSALEAAYLEALRAVDRATIDGQTLTLSGPGAQLEYLAAAPE